jgi:hypothetical protein
MVRVLIYLQMVIRLQERIFKENQKDLASINGKMEVFIWESLKKGSNMARVNGKKILTPKFAIITRVVTTGTRRMDMEYSSGKVVMYSEAITGMMSEMVTEKCFGLMVPSIKVSGGKEFSMASARCFSLTVQ